jgi:hypothetical protein
LKAHIQLEILPQPDDTTCGPTCLHAVYKYYGDVMPLDTVISEVSTLEGGGTLGAWLADHALRRGYRATIYTYNLQLFDPTWFGEPPTELADKLKAQLQAKSDPKLRASIGAYLEFIERGGQVRHQDLTLGLIRRYLTRGHPVIAGLSATYLYQCARERADGNRLVADDVAGEPTGHFVLLCGYDPDQRTVQIADPFTPNPLSGTTIYSVRIERVQCAILLSVLTYDANLLVLEPPRSHRKKGDRSCTSSWS